jgi:hypothetical protein
MTKSSASRLFGKAGSRYDFQGVNLPQIRKQCAELETQQKSASRKVNNKVMSMIDRFVNARRAILSTAETETFGCRSQYREEGSCSQEEHGHSPQR